jgi:hypothetical protein
MSASELPQDLSDQELLNESGRNWNQWFSEMENKGFDELRVFGMSEKLLKEYSLELPCARVIALRFCQYIGKCDLNDSANVFEVSVTKTFNYPVDEVFGRATDWFETENRTELQSIVNQKRLNCRWLSDNSTIDVKFQKKSSSKTTLIVQHERLESESDAEIMRNFWKRSIPNMIETL